MEPLYASLGNVGDWPFATRHDGPEIQTILRAIAVCTSPNVNRSQVLRSGVACHYPKRASVTPHVVRVRHSITRILTGGHKDRVRLQVLRDDS